MADEFIDTSKMKILSKNIDLMEEKELSKIMKKKVPIDEKEILIKE